MSELPANTLRWAAANGYRCVPYTTDAGLHKWRLIWQGPKRGRMQPTDPPLFDNAIISATTKFPETPA